MGEFLEFQDVLQEIRGAMNPGRLKLQDSSVIFKNLKTGIVDQFPSNDVISAIWMVRARGYCLRLVLSNDIVHRFDGFRESDFDKLSAFLKKCYNITLEKKDLSVKGWNWGSVNFEGNSLDFEVNNKTMFEIPLGNVSHSTKGKNEVTLEFHQNDDAAVSLMELRFHIPGDKDIEVDSVEEFYKNVVQKADIIQATGTAIAIFSEVQCLTPRGRYDIKLYPSFLQLHGKTFDYKIPFTTILRLFLLPHRDSQMYFVMSLDPPIKQGQTRYHFVIMLFNKEDEMTLEMGLKEDEIEEKYAGKLMKEMSGLEYEIVSRVMKTLVNRKITVPGSFISNSSSRSIGCSYKAATGSLYPLERGFIFVHKPPMHIRFDEIANVNFARSVGNTRSFDFDVETKTGVVFTFVGIEKEEYGKLYDFVVTQKKLRVKNVGGKLSKGGYREGMSGSEEEGEHDAYMERMKAEGEQRDDDGAGDDDDDDSTDESFAPGESGSDVAEEYDSEVQDTDDSEGGGGGGGGDSDKESKPKAVQKKPRKERAAKPEKERTRKKRGSKKEKDPTQPKRPQSSYFLWLNSMRATIKEDNPGISVTEISKKAGELWKKIDPDEKEKFDKLSAKEKVKYEEAMSIWREKKRDESPESPSGAPSPKKRRKQPKTPQPTKSPTKSSGMGGTGENFKSKEFISSDDSDDEAPRKVKAEQRKVKAEVKGKSNASSDASGYASGNDSGDASNDASGDASGDASNDASGDESGKDIGDASNDASGDESGKDIGDASNDASGDASGNDIGDASGNDASSAADSD